MRRLTKTLHASAAAPAPPLSHSGTPPARQFAVDLNGESETVASAKKAEALQECGEPLQAVDPRDL